MKLTLLNKEFLNFFKNEKLWFRRLMEDYGKIAIKSNSIDFSKYKGYKTWKEYYIEVYKNVSSQYSYYHLAMSLHNQRDDLYTIIKACKGVKDVYRVSYQDKAGYTIYYTRDGTLNGIREGIFLNKNEEQMSYQFYVNGCLIEETLTCNEILREKCIYDINDRELKEKYVYDINGIKIFECHREGQFYNAKQWHPNGKLKGSGDIYREKKYDVWTYWNTKGEFLKKVLYGIDGKVERVSKNPMEWSY